MSVRDHIPTISHDGVVYRAVRWDSDEPDALVDLQTHIWSRETATPIPHLIAAEGCGGVVLGAYADQETIGFSYAFPAYLDGESWLHSHQTGLRADWRGRGVGAALKWLQRAVATALGHRLVTWTFDPLQARNAHFNVNKLGAAVTGYKIDVYGTLVDSQNVGVATDRLWVDWRLDDTDVIRRAAEFERRTGMGLGASTVPAAPGRPDTRPRDGVVRIDTPGDLEALREERGIEAIAEWRQKQREAFTSAFDRGLTVVGFETDDTGVGWYVLG